MTDTHQPPDDQDALELSDLLSHVLDKGVVITGDVIISVAGVDLVSVSLGVLITAIETIERRRATVSARLPGMLGIPVLPPPRDA